MQLEDLTYLLQHPQDITVDQTSALATLIAQYPYFQPARSLYLKGLKNKESFKYNQELKTTAAYTTDRSILFDFITSETFNQNEISQLIKQNSEHIKAIIVNEANDISVNKSVMIDEALKQHIQNSEGVLDPYLFEEKVKTEDVAQFIADINEAPKLPLIDIDTENIQQTPEEQLNIGKPLEFKKSETHSFTEWLQITSFKPIHRDEDEKNESSEEKIGASIDKKFELIDKFLDANPKIVKKKKKPKQNIILCHILIRPHPPPAPRRLRRRAPPPAARAPPPSRRARPA
ncbi:MAG: hypothetical protein KDD03_07475, partial [Gelidibacter sp.]|nr:hypothetical protein [Gelidibacter sp.]